MTRRPIIIDTDPGQDDAIAILLALGAHARLDVLALTTVGGNVPLRLTQRNARIVCEWARRPDVPVYAGCSAPLVNPPVTAEEVHGSEGLDGPALHEPRMPLQAVHAVDYLVDTLRSHPVPVTLCTLGPLTNIAAALVKAPDIAARVERLVMMGGAYFEGGNITPNGEFNVFADPHAADKVLTSGMPITMVPLDATHKVLATRARLARLEALGNHAGRVTAQILTAYQRIEMERFAGDGGPMHDPCVIAWLLAPSLFAGREVNVRVETRGEFTQGATVVDWRGNTGRAPNALYLTQADADGFFDLLVDNLALLP